MPGQQNSVDNIYVKLTGDTMTGPLVLDADPATDLEAATKQYVDNIESETSFKTPCLCATTANLSADYDNGALGVGATLTNNGAQAAFSVDGITPAVGERVLVKNQGTATQNGIYEVTDVGSGATDWVLTRTADFDTPSETELGSIVPVVQGNNNAATAWMLTSTVASIGVSNITFTQFISQVIALPVSGANGGTGVDNTGKTITLGGDFETSGAFDVTLNATAASNITIPTTGKLSEVLLSTTNMAGQTTVEVTGLSTTYHSYRIEIANLVPSANGAALYYRTSSNNGVSYDSGAGEYQYSSFISRATASDVTYIRSTTNTLIQIGSAWSNTGSAANNLILRLLMAATSLNYNGPLFDCMYFDNALGLSRVNGQGNRVTTQVNNAFQLLWSSGTFTSGTLKVYGILA